MTTLETIAQDLNIAEPWVQKGRAHWLVCDGISTRTVAAAMMALGARFITITAMQLPGDGAIRMDYHWDLDGQLLGFQFLPGEKKVDSIYDLCEAANWIEREIHEYFNLDFTGREYEPLFLRNGEKPGVNLREEDE